MKQILQHYHYIFLILSIVGGFTTYYFLFMGMQNNGYQLDIPVFLQSTWTNNYGKSLTIDFWTTAITATIFILAEGKRLQMKYIWFYIITTFIIAIAFSFPLFLFARAQKLRNKSQND
jgi:Terpene cyclase DEP1